MGNEIEIKWLINCSNNITKEILGYEQLPNLNLTNQNPKQIFEKLETLIFELKYTPNIIAIDQFYWPISNKSIENIEKLKYYENGFYLDNKKILELYKTSSTDYEALELIKLIQYFNSNPNKEAFKRQLRIRTENNNNNTSIYLTAKNKTGNGDEQNIECEIELTPNQDLNLFFNSINYESKQDRKKTKRKNKFSGYIKTDTEEIKTNIEFVKIDELKGLEFLEIEMLPKVITNNSSLIEKIYEIGKKLEIPKNHQENRGYQVLQNILNEKK